MKKIEVAEAKEKLDELRRRIAVLNQEKPEQLHTEKLMSIEHGLDGIVATVFNDLEGQERSET